MTITQEQKDLIFGTLLGDGNLQTENGGRTWRYRGLQKLGHKDYLFHKYYVLKEFCSAEPGEGSTFDERTNKTYYRCYFNTRYDDVFRFYGNMFYFHDSKQDKWVKRVPSNQNLYKFLTPGALSYMYMDDGSLKWKGQSNAMLMCTESFAKDDVARIVKVLEAKHSIVAKQTPKNKKDPNSGDRIYIPEKSSAAFRELIKPYLVECMKYKVSNGNKGHL